MPLIFSMCKRGFGANLRYGFGLKMTRKKEFAFQLLSQTTSYRDPICKASDFHFYSPNLLSPLKLANFGQGCTFPPEKQIPVATTTKGSHAPGQNYSPELPDFSVVCGPDSLL